MARGKFITLEGLSGVGKTTIARKLAQASVKNVYVKTPSELFRKSREEVDGGKYSTQARFFYYLAGLVRSSDEINDIVKTGLNVICDRYIWTTVCWHETIGFPGYKYVPEILTPDYEILITCPTEERHHRLFSRDEFTINDSDELRNGIEEIFFEKLQSRHKVLIENTGDVDLVVEKIRKEYLGQ